MRCLRRNAGSRTIVAILSCLAAGNAAAQSTPAAQQRIHLWREIHAGMSKPEVKALYPKWQAELSADCPVSAIFTKETAIRDYVWRLEDHRIRLAMHPAGGFNLIFTVRDDGKLY